ncbi:hypothetical protein [Marinicrinis lubricantis]|uniref:Uncharacterized protein n=1 Tax=Marinicrinis lubricantis TaxID=2086470 RepID=A0ABW1INR1_9BACL
MAFGLTREKLTDWKNKVNRGEIAFLTHYWLDPRFPDVRTVTKVGCSDIQRLMAWCGQYGLPSKYIHHRESFPHFDLIGPKQKEILQMEGQWEQIDRFLKEKGGKKDDHDEALDIKSMG